MIIYFFLRVNDFSRYLSGLEPYRPYVLRVRARNEVLVSHCYLTCA